MRTTLRENLRHRAQSAREWAEFFNHLPGVGLVKKVMVPIGAYGFLNCFSNEQIEGFLPFNPSLTNALETVRDTNPLEVVEGMFNNWDHFKWVIGTIVVFGALSLRRAQDYSEHADELEAEAK